MSIRVGAASDRCGGVGSSGALGLLVTRVAIAAGALSASASGCAGPRPDARPLPAWVTVALRTAESNSTPPKVPVPTGASRRSHVLPVANFSPPKPLAGIAGRNPAADLVVATLQSQGAKFGTDGSVAALWGYLGSSALHRRIKATEVQPGDVVFFQLYAPEPQRDCQGPDHVGLVVETESDGRVTFLESRGGLLRRSFVDPRMPQTRRDENGSIRNSILRPRRIADREDAPLFAGEMLCAAVHPYL